MSIILLGEISTPAIAERSVLHRKRFRSALFRKDGVLGKMDLLQWQGRSQRPLAIGRQVSTANDAAKNPPPPLVVLRTTPIFAAMATKLLFEAWMALVCTNIWRHDFCSAAPIGGRPIPPPLSATDELSPGFTSELTFCHRGRPAIPMLMDSRREGAIIASHAF
jgi:hypothetical protein